MIPVQQTTFGNGNGNCLLACVASLLHRPISDIPDFNLSGAGWFEEMYEWCRNENMGLILVNPSDLERSLFMNCFCIMIYTIHGVESENHAVIGKCQRVERSKVDEEGIEKWKWQAEVVFDPNPKGAAIDELKHLVFITECAPAPAQGTPEPPKVEEFVKTFLSRLAGLTEEQSSNVAETLTHMLRPYFPPASQTPNSCPSAETFVDNFLRGNLWLSAEHESEKRDAIAVLLKNYAKHLLATPASTARTDGQILCAICTKNPALKPHGYCQECYTQWYGQTEPTITPAAPGSVPQAEPPKDCEVCGDTKVGRYICPAHRPAQPGDAPQKEKP